MHDPSNPQTTHAERALDTTSTTTRPSPRRTRLTLDRVISAALELAAEVGADHFTMKDIAGRLEVGTMSLYYYISDKADLLTHMVGKIYADIEVPSRARPWRERLEAIAYQLYRGHQAVPGLDPHLFMLAEPPLTSVLAVAQAAYDAAIDGGLDERHATLTSRAVLGYAADRGASTAKRLAIRRTNPAVRKMTAVDGNIDMVEGPTYAELVSDYDDVFSFGLSCLLDGVAAQMTGGSAS